MRKALQALAVVVVAALLARFYPEQSADYPSSPGGPTATVEAAYEAHRSGEMLHARGTVVKLLRDDNKGSRHQKFILRTSPGHTVLVSHNIDLAPRINTLREGDTVRLYGQYEYNDRGGVVHWTHHAPQGDHEGGWIEHEGRRYE